MIVKFVIQFCRLPLTTGKNLRFFCVWKNINFVILPFKNWLSLDWRWIPDILKRFGLMLSGKCELHLPAYIVPGLVTKIGSKRSMRGFILKWQCLTIRQHGYPDRILQNLCLKTIGPKEGSCWPHYRISSRGLCLIFKRKTNKCDNLWLNEATVKMNLLELYVWLTLFKQQKTTE